jgi:hypothetical protein
MFDDIAPAHVLVVLGVGLLVAPALAPVQQYRIHETTPETPADRATLEERGVEVIAYENLSDRGQELYRETLRNGGRYAVPVGQGAPDFGYGTDDPADGEPESVRRRPGVVAIERPPDADLPPADESERSVERARREARERAEERERRTDADDANRTRTRTRTTPDTEAIRERVQQYDLMGTRTDTPPLTDSGTLLRLLSVLGAVCCLCIGGYRGSKPT